MNGNEHLKINTLQGILRASHIKDGILTLPASMLSDIIRSIVVEDFSGDWYAANNPDVKQAIDEGGVLSAFEHYVQSGAAEGRIPFYVDIDESDYLRRHPDVSDAILNRAVDDASSHFHRIGFSEGRSFVVKPSRD